MSDTQAPGAPSAAPTEQAPVESTEVLETESSEDEGSDESQEVQASAPKKETKATIAKKKLKLKVFGKELEEEFDPNDDEYLTRQFQMAKMGQKHASDHSALQKQVNTFIEELRKNPRKVLSDPNIGIDIKQLAAQVIEEEIQNSQKSPEQLEFEKAQNELKALKEEREKEKEEFRKKELERIQNQEYERYDMLMTQALEKSDLPKSPYIIKKMADYMLLGLENGIDVAPNEIVPLVKEEMQNDLKEMFAVMPDEVVEALVGKDVLNRIRKKNVAKAKGGQPPVPSKSALKDTGAKKETKEAEDKKANFRQFFGI